MIFGYTGREFDEESGLQYNRARYYDPSNGRFISTDPIGFAGGDANLYGYVGNNPIILVDPSGLRPAINFAQCRVVLSMAAMPSISIFGSGSALPWA